MKRTKDAKRKLKKSSVLDSLRSNPFDTPRGYFKNQKSHLTTITKLYFFGNSTENDSGFTVPDQYFSDLSKKIIAKSINAATATPEIETTQFDTNQGQVSSILDKKLTSGMTVPEDYFESSCSLLETLLKLENRGFISENQGFSTPPNYFVQAEKRIAGRIKQQIQSNNTVPIRPVEMELQAYNTKKEPSLFSSKYWTAGLIAASILLFVSIGVYFNNSTTQKTIDYPQPQGFALNEISDEEIINYLALNHENEDLIYDSSFSSEDSEEVSKDTQDIVRDLEHSLKLLIK